jgi:hypothetical protein
MGTPAVVHLRLLHTSVVPLGGTPTREWEVLFRQPLDFTSVYHPNRIRIEKGRLVFESEEQHVPTWLHYIDKWIASANQRLAEGRAGDDAIPAVAPSWSVSEMEAARV